MSQLIFITGGSGFIGTHIILELLAAGYRVRATARGSKVDQLKADYAEYKDQFEAVAITDVATDNFTDALKGVDAVIHSAAPLAQGRTAEEILAGNIDGALNVLRQAEKAGIKRFVFTSSLITVQNPKFSYTDKDWNPITYEEAVTGGPVMVYRASKTLAEKAVWEFADSHSNIDITTLNPPFVYGPYAKNFKIPEPNYTALSTNLYLYRLLTPKGNFPAFPVYIDVRDVAKLHVLALKSPLTSHVGRKRILLTSPHGFKFTDVLDIIASKRPELKDRLVDAEKAPKFPFDRAPIDFGRVEQVLGYKKEDFQPVEDTILSTVDDLLKFEKEWQSKGFTVEIPTA